MPSCPTTRCILKTGALLFLGLWAWAGVPSAAFAQDFVERTASSNSLRVVSADEYATPYLCDFNNDFRLDAVVGGLSGTVRFFRNTGIATVPVFSESTGAANPLRDALVNARSVPAPVDIDGDGRMDVFVGAGDGTILYCQNTGTVSTPAFTTRTGTLNPFNGVDVGSNAAPVFVDIDNDGDRDCFIGTSTGQIRYFENRGGANSPSFTERTGGLNPLGGVSAGGDIVPAFSDWDDDGDYDLFVGKAAGSVLYYENTGSAAFPAFTLRPGLLNPFDQVDVGDAAAPCFGDLDGDGDPDAAIGTKVGNVRYFEQTMVIVVSEPIIYDLNGDESTYGADSGTVLVDQATPASVTDADSANFDGGSLTVSCAAGVPAEDVLSIRNEGTGAGQIGLSGTDVSYAGVVIGTVSGGSAGVALEVAFNIEATPQAVGALLRNVTYQNTAGPNFTEGARTIRFTITDGDGGTSASVSARIFAVRLNHAPVIAEGPTASVVMDEDGAPRPFALNLGAADADGDTLVWRISLEPQHGIAGIYGWNTGADVSYASVTGYSGSDSFEIEVDDGLGGRDNIVIQVTITPANNPPILEPIGAKSAQAGVALSFTAHATDSDSASLTYSASNLPDGATLNSISGVFQWTPRLDQTGLYPGIVIQVRDDYAPPGIDSETISIQVLAVQSEGEGEPIAEGEGEAIAEGEGEPIAEGEGEVAAEGEGEIIAEGEGEPIGEGEGEAAGDTTPPDFVAGPVIDGVDDTMALISWTAGEMTEATCLLWAEDGTPLDPFPARGPATENSVELTGLEPGSVYYFAIELTDLAGNTARSEETRLITADKSFSLGLMGPWITDRGEDSAVIEWGTDTPATGELRYGLDAAALDSVSQASQRTDTQSIQLTRLSPDTVYYCQVTAEDILGNTAASDVLEFTTLSAPIPEALGLSGPWNTSLGKDFAVIEWATNLPATGELRYGAAAGALDSVLEAPQMANTQSVRLAGLKAFTVYYYQVTVTDASGNTAESPVLVLMTVPDMQRLEGEFLFEGEFSWNFHREGESACPPVQTKGILCGPSGDPSDAADWRWQILWMAGILYGIRRRPGLRGNIRG